MGNIQIDMMYFINNGLQSPFLDTVVPVIYSVTDVRVIFALIILVLIGSKIFKHDMITRIAMYCLAAFYTQLYLLHSTIQLGKPI